MAFGRHSRLSGAWRGKFIKNWVKSWKNYKVRQRKKSVAKLSSKETEEWKGQRHGRRIKGVTLKRMFIHTHKNTYTLLYPSTADCILFIIPSLLFVCFFRLYCSSSSRQEIEIKKSQEIFQEIKMGKRVEKSK